MHIVPIALDIDPSLAIHDADIRRVFSAGMLSAGRTYEQRGRVQELEIMSRGAVITATTQGTQPDPYIQSLKITRTPGDGIRISGACSCPMGRGVQASCGGGDSRAKERVADFPVAGGHIATACIAVSAEGSASPGPAVADPGLAGRLRSRRRGTDRGIPAQHPHADILRPGRRSKSGRRTQASDRSP